ncbi:MAG: hypothetical protein GKR98_03635 [Boseongicola sp.]|nr:MAG: hypothetical protein GKR98_03635 [Boseongicola sp.]
MPLKTTQRILQRSVADKLGLIAAGVAFYAFLAAFPAIAALVALAGLFTDPDAVVRQLENVTELIPQQAAQLLVGEAAKVASAPDQSLTLTVLFGLIVAVYLSTRAAASLIHGLNVALGLKENRGFLRYWLVVIGLTVALLFGTVVMLVLMVGLPTVLAFVPL